MDLLFVSPVITELLASFPRIELYDGTRAAYFTEYHFIDEPAVSVDEAREEGSDYAIPVWATMRVQDRGLDEILEQIVYLCDVPLMLDNGHFIIDGFERIIPPEIEQSPEGTWRTGAIAEAFYESFKTRLNDVVNEVRERLPETEWEYLIPQDLLDSKPFVRAILAIFDNSPIEDDAYHRAAEDCVCCFYQEDTELRPYDDEDTYEYRVKYEEESIDVSGPITFVGYLFAQSAMSLQ